MQDATGNRQRLLFLVALKLEASALLEQVPFHQEHVAGSTFFRSPAIPFDLLRTGMGAPRDPQKLRAVLKALSPGAVVNIGFCGAVDPKWSPGQPLVINQAQHCLPDGTRLASESLEPLHAWFPGLPWPESTVCTLPEPLTSENLRDRMRALRGNVVVDMECFYLATLVHSIGIPCSAVKVISDFADHHAALIFRLQKAVLKHNLSTAFQTLVAHFNPA